MLRHRRFEVTANKINRIEKDDEVQQQCGRWKDYELDLARFWNVHKLRMWSAECSF